MYAVIKTGGKQYRVEKGQTFRVEKIDGLVGDSVTIEDVLLVSDGEEVKAGADLLKDAKVTVTITDQNRAKKIVVFKKKRRKGYSRIKGHRQHFTALKVEDITV